MEERGKFGEPGGTKFRTFDLQITLVKSPLILRERGHIRSGCRRSESRWVPSSPRRKECRSSHSGNWLVLLPNFERGFSATRAREEERPPSSLRWPRLGIPRHPFDFQPSLSFNRRSNNERRAGSTGNRSLHRNSSRISLYIHLFVNYTSRALVIG